MKNIIDDIYDLLRADMLSYGVLEQQLRNSVGCEQGVEDLDSLLERLLSAGDVEIGTARLANPAYVEFLAWTGSIESRIERAHRAVEGAEVKEKPFAYWLCLKKNVDRYES